MRLSSSVEGVAYANTPQVFTSLTQQAKEISTLPLLSQSDFFASQAISPQFSTR